MAASLEFVTVDVFTGTKFKGNPLALIDVPRSVTLSQEQKQAIAKEFNLSETVFLHESDSDDTHEWRVDIFTLDQELTFAGHPTIGTASILGWRNPRLTSAVLRVKAGPIQIKYDRDPVSRKLVSSSASIPHDVHIHSNRYSRQQIVDSQPHVPGLKAEQTDFPVVSPVKGMTFVLVGLPSREDLSRVSTTANKTIPALDSEYSPSFCGIYYYHIAEDGRVHTRMIEGALEDPATGSAACTLSAFLANGSGRKFHIVQGQDMGRESHIGVEIKTHDGGEIAEVILSGSAVEVMAGKLTV